MYVQKGCNREKVKGLSVDTAGNGIPFLSTLLYHHLLLSFSLLGIPVYNRILIDIQQEEKGNSRRH